MLVFVIFIFAAASVCASDVNDTAIASEDDMAIELSQADSDEEISAVEHDEIINEGICQENYVMDEQKIYELLISGKSVKEIHSLGYPNTVIYRVKNKIKIS